MLKKLFHSRLYVLFLSLVLIGFIIGYLYSVMSLLQAEKKEPDTVKTLQMK